ncbi:MAG: NADH-quinone oxidoreductase subunit J [Pseudomonadota bacterium]
MIPAIFFYVFSAILIFSSIMVISVRNPVHSVLFLVLAFFNAASLFVMLGAEFIAMTLAIVYIGAVAVLFLFAVMMLDINTAGLRKGMMKYISIGGVVGLVLLGELIWIYSSWKVEPGAMMRVASPPDASVATNTHALGLVLYTDYIYLFQLAGLILLVAMIGTITITLRKRTGVRKQDVSGQVASRPEDILKIVKVATGAGVP